MSQKLLWVPLAGLLMVAAGCGRDSPSSSTAAEGTGSTAAAASTTPRPHGRTPAPPPLSVADLPQWTPDQAMLKELETEQTDPLLGKYRIRPPKGCRFAKMESKKADRFGALFSDGMWGPADLQDADSLPLLHMSIWQLGIPSPEPPQIAIRKLMAGDEQSIADCRFDAIEIGQVAGIPIARARFTGTEGTHKLRGILYVAVDGDRIISLESRSTASRPERALRVVEAAVLTLRRVE
jgi:hypothetical protein